MQPTLVQSESITLFGIEQHTLDLLDHRQDCIERIAGMGMPIPENLADWEDAQAELTACNSELSRLAGAEAQKVDNIANLLKMCDRMILHRKDERDRQNRAAKRWEAIKEGVENIVIEALTFADRTRFDTPTNTLRIQRNPPAVNYTDPMVIPSRFIKVTIEVSADRWKQMKEALPELSEFCAEKGRAFKTADIAKVLKQAAKEESAAKELMEGPELEKALKQIERVRGAELKSDIRLVVE